MQNNMELILKAANQSGTMEEQGKIEICDYAKLNMVITAHVGWYELAKASIEDFYKELERVLTKEFPARPGFKERKIFAKHMIDSEPMQAIFVDWDEMEAKIRAVLSDMLNKELPARILIADSSEYHAMIENLTLTASELCYVLSCLDFEKDIHYKLVTNLVGLYATNDCQTHFATSTDCNTYIYEDVLENLILKLLPFKDVETVEKTGNGVWFYSDAEKR